jgi:hypothetical protein
MNCLAVSERYYQILFDAEFFDWKLLLIFRSSSICIPIAEALNIHHICIFGI